MNGELLALDTFVQKIIEDGGEGIILQKGYSLYESGRSSSLLKLKVFTFPSSSLSFVLIFIKSSQIDQEGIIEAIRADSVLLRLYVTLFLFLFGCFSHYIYLLYIDPPAQRY